MAGVVTEYQHLEIPRQAHAKAKQWKSQKARNMENYRTIGEERDAGGAHI
jgi:hypothetical protein